MKLSKVFSFYLVFLTSTFCMAQAELSGHEAIKTWILPVIGPYEFAGNDPDCQNLEIMIWGADSNYYAVRIGTFDMPVFYADDADLSEDELNYKHRSASGVFGNGEQYKETIKLVKDATGKLIEVRVKTQSKPSFFSWNWTTMYDFVCSATD